MIRLAFNQWSVIRQIWEFDPDEPTYVQSGKRAGEKHGFQPPSKPAIGKRARKEGWERRGSLAGINQAAHRIADRLADHKPKVRGGGTAYNDPDARSDSATAATEERHGAEFRRAEIRVRHRQEWEQIVILRKEALKHRDADPDQTFHRLKITKIAAETTTIQQNGECKAWGMDELIDTTRLKSMSDNQLEAMVAGKRIA